MPICTPTASGCRRPNARKRALGVAVAFADGDELPPAFDDALRRLDRQIHALLMDEAGHEGEQRRAREAQAERAADEIGVAALPALRIEQIGAVAVGARIPVPSPGR